MDRRVLAAGHHAPAASAHPGATFAPFANRIYSAPFTQAGQIAWRYIDCRTGATGTYFAGGHHQDAPAPAPAPRAGEAAPSGAAGSPLARKEGAG